MTVYALAAIVALAPVVVARSAGAACVPDELVRAIVQADSVRLVVFGRPGRSAVVLADSARGTSSDCPGRRCIRVSGRPARLLILAFGRADAFDCGTATTGADWSGGETGVLGLEFAAGPNVVRMLLRFPEGSLDVGRVGGVRYGVRGSREASRRWREFLGACAEERRVVARDFLHELLESASRESGPETESSAAPADTLCELGGRGYSYIQDLPEVVTRVEPEWPDVEHARGSEATVLLRVLVCRDGRVHDVRVLRSVPLLDEAAAAAVRQWVFKPARENGRPIACWVAVPIRFRFQ